MTEEVIGYKLEIRMDLDIDFKNMPKKFKKDFEKLMKSMKKKSNSQDKFRVDMEVIKNENRN